MSPEDVTRASARLQETTVGQSRLMHESAVAEARFRGFIEVAPDAIVTVNKQGKIVLVNGQTEALFGYGREEMLDQPVELLLPERFRAGHIAHREGYTDGPRIRPMGANLELYGRRKDGTEFPVEISLGPVQVDGEMAGRTPVSIKVVPQAVKVLVDS